ncbi:hypothetical protein [Streptomyces sp. B5E4]|uniref:transcriptional repressor NsdA n=1 Tax=Streptomyces sp. B5E4 TaxID=3153568 RepID=UPI00325EA75E
MDGTGGSRTGATGAGKGPNKELTSWFLRSGWSKGELARQVNRRARQLGAHHLSTDTSRVRRWLDGEQPREPIPRILSDLFSERFGCVVGVDQLGLHAARPRPAVSGVDLPWNAAETVKHISEFSRSDLMLARRGFLGTSLNVAAGPVLVEPMQRWLAQPPAPGGLRATVPAPAAAVPAGARSYVLSGPELELLETTTAKFRQWDAQCGGGLRRKAVVGQLHEITDLLQEPHPYEVAERLFRITAELSQLAGWMSYDVGLQPTAQKYFVLALHAAKEAADRPLGAYVLSSMARQMIHLGRADDALELIHLAQYGSRDSATARTQSMLYAMEARAYANLGRPDRCHRAVRMAEDCFADIDPGGSEPDWIRFFSEAELNSENAHSYRDLAYVAGRSPTYAALARPVMARAVELFAADAERRRSYALNLVGLATVHLLEEDPEQCALCAGEALTVARQVRSERVNTRLRKTVDTAVRRYGAVGEVADLADRLARELPEAVEATG